MAAQRQSGWAAAAIAKKHGGIAVSTTRRPDREWMLRASGAEQVIIDAGSIAEQVRALHPEGFDKVLELIGTTTLEDSLRCVKAGGVVCMTSMMGNKWSIDNFSPMESIPPAVSLTTYDSDNFMLMPLDELAKQVAAGTLHIQIGKIFHLDDIVEAHRCMEEDEAGGKIVVLI